MYSVYTIVQNNVCLYIGHTKDLKKREYQHNYSYRKGKSKELYDYLRTLEVQSIELNQVATFKSKVAAKRFEMYLILHYKFIKESGLEVPKIESTDLKQKIPHISDR